ncbi:hypothetical protein M758_7G106800 [Ceratodon purpureus]|nr:hypothetical protein M758_7G106800 [Ceratodon purpureus]
MAAMECASRATFVTAVSNAARCPCRTTASLPCPSFFGLKSVRVASVHTPRASVLGGARRNANLSVRAQAQSQSAGDNVAVAGVTNFKSVLLPIIMDRNPYLSEATRQAAATTTALATKFGAEITVVVIDEDKTESQEDHDTRMKNIRWHLAEGGFEEFKLMERVGEGKRPAVVIGEVADDMNLDLVVLSMESIHSKHIDSNLLAEFVPCPVLLLPL